MFRSSPQEESFGNGGGWQCLVVPMEGEVYWCLGARWLNFLKSGTVPHHECLSHAKYQQHLLKRIGRSPFSLDISNLSSFRGQARKTWNIVRLRFYCAWCFIKGHWKHRDSRIWAEAEQRTSDWRLLRWCWSQGFLGPIPPLTQPGRLFGPYLPVGVCGLKEEHIWGSVSTWANTN